MKSDEYLPISVAQKNVKCIFDKIKHTDAGLTAMFPLADDVFHIKNIKF